MEQTFFFVEIVLHERKDVTDKCHLIIPSGKIRERLAFLGAHRDISCFKERNQCPEIPVTVQIPPILDVCLDLVQLLKRLVERCWLPHGIFLLHAYRLGSYWLRFFHGWHGSHADAGCHRHFRVFKQPFIHDAREFHELAERIRDIEFAVLDF